MNSRATPKFWKLYEQLPYEVRQRARKQYELFQNNPAHRSLEFKKVSSRLNAYSARVTDDYRVVGQMDSRGMLWFWIGPHDEYDKLLKRM